MLALYWGACKALHKVVKSSYNNVIMGNKLLKPLYVSNILREQKPVTMVMATMGLVVVHASLGLNCIWISDLCFVY